MYPCGTPQLMIGKLNYDHLITITNCSLWGKYNLNYSKGWGSQHVRTCFFSLPKISFDCQSFCTLETSMTIRKEKQEPVTQTAKPNHLKEREFVMN